MLKHKLLLFKKKEDFEVLLNSDNIDPESIVFIKEPLLIYTHGQYWNCTGNADETNLLEFLTKNGYLKQGAFLGKINDIEFYQGGSITVGKSNPNDPQTQTEDKNTTYNAGIGIQIEGTTIKLKPATVDEIGGIRLGYPINGNNRPVLIDGMHRAYVTIPAQTNPTTTTTSKYYEMMFKATDTDSIPDLPTDTDLKGWASYAPNASGKQVVWMIVRLIDGGSVGPWDGPMRISGANGEAGIDGDEFEYIYRLSNDGVNAPSLFDLNTQTDDYVPSGWTDNPSGITQENRYEWMSFRRKIHSETDKKGTWSKFSPAVLWSAWGKNGLDGDGVEYIFYTSSGNYPLEDPQDWTNDALFNTREYIRNYTETNAPNQWQDDPYDLNEMPLGSKTWVSVRKQTTNSNGVTTWGPYSAPALWAYYPKDGDAGTGLVADFDNDMMAVSVNDTGYNYEFEQRAAVFLYNGVSPITITNYEIIGIKDRVGRDLDYSSYIYKESPNKIVVKFNANTINFDTVGSISVTVRVYGKINGATVNRDAVLQIIGVKFGKGYTYYLNTSHSIIKHNKDHSIRPDRIECWCAYSSGTEVFERWFPTLIAEKSMAHFDSNEAKFKFRYSIDDNGLQDLNQLDYVLTNGVESCIRFDLMYKHEGSWILVDSETVYVVEDGTNGSIIPSVSYDILVVKSTLTKLSDGSKFTGQVCYKIQRVEGNTRTNVGSSDLNTYEIDTQVLFGGTTVGAIQYSSSNERWESSADYVWNDNFTFTQINVRSGNTIIAAVVVPTIIQGPKGELGDPGTPGAPGTPGEPGQSLAYSVMRLRVWEENATPAYNNGTVGESGIFYQDVVGYYNDLYLCLTAGVTSAPATISTANGKTTIEVNLGWQKFETMSAVSFEALVANSAYIKNLTAQLIIVNGKAGGAYENKPVAGIVNGTYITSRDGLDQDQDNGIRIFAGPIPNTGNISKCAFTVDQSGVVKAGGRNVDDIACCVFDSDGTGWLAYGNVKWKANGEFTIGSQGQTLFKPDGSGYIANNHICWDTDGNFYNYDKTFKLNADGSGQVAKGKISWTSDGLITLALNPIYNGGSNYSGTGSITNAIIIEHAQWINPAAHYNLLHLEGLIIRNGFVLSCFTVVLDMNSADYAIASNNEYLGTTFKDIHAETDIYPKLKDEVQFSDVFSEGTRVRIQFMGNGVKMVTGLTNVNSLFNEYTKLSIYAETNYIWSDSVVWGS